MTRYHGITAMTYSQLVLDAGAVYLNFIDLDNLGELLGATRGGATFTRTPKYVDLPVEGVPYQVVGSKFLVGVEATLEVHIVTIQANSLGAAIPNRTAVLYGDNDEFARITEEWWDPVNVHRDSNIVLIAETTSGDPAVITLDNPICESDCSLPFRDKSEVVSVWKFHAYAAADDIESPPWRIDMPLGAIVDYDIEETGSSVEFDYEETGTATTDIREGSVWP